MDYHLPKNSGLQPNPFDPRDVWEDELGAHEVVLPQHHRTEGLLFEPQGALPYCVAFATTKMAEEVWVRVGVKEQYSQPWLFHNSGGTINGSYFRANLEVATERGLVSYSTLPMPADIWDLKTFSWLEREALKLPPDATKKVKGYVRVNPDPNTLKKAILRYGAVMTGVAASGGYWEDRAKRPVGKPDNHAVLLTGWSPDAWWVFDSLQPTANFDGYHTLDSSYQFLTAYGVTELPANWRELRDRDRASPKGNTERYGRPRDYAAEVSFASEMLATFKRFRNQSVLEAAGRFWEMYIRAGVYGGYNLSYTKWGRWMPGDILNDCYNWRRTGYHLFDFDKLRSEHK